VTSLPPPDRDPSRLLLWGLAAFGLCLAWVFVTVPSSGEDQLVIALFGFVLLFILNRRGGRRITLVLMAISALMSLRYLHWRYTETFAPETALQGFFMLGLLLAESYAVGVLLLSYFQTAWPLDRKPVPLPANPRQWPSVDVFIPTYNESLEVVKPTVMAALAMDWPEDKLNVYILDDGRRPEFRAFAEQVGCGYIVRPDNKGAKAGNINHALQLTDGEFVAIFDCDHVPTRAFLQLSMGWMLRDPKLGLIQLPHHFYSLDPFQRNLAKGRDVPAEGLIFYGLVQPGNDLWNAAFFCGSCAVLRRAALEQIGGVPTETVTEDAHCSLRLQRRGWNTAYLRVPLAAGLATERLALHIGQRMRWARGMVQILRRDNPLFGPGLTLAQRLCYFAAMFSWFFPLPRIVFLTAPLAFLLFQIPVIAASPLAIVAYAGPHIVHAVATASRTASRVRHSFWSEVYETVLAVFLAPVVLITLIDPKRGKFNVTGKGGTLEEGYFDLRAVWPNLVVFLLLTAGLVFGLVGIASHEPSSMEFQAYLLNSVWAFLCLFPTLAGVALGRERRQQRVAARIEAHVPAVLKLGDAALPGVTVDLSVSGARVRLEAQSPEQQLALDELAASRGREIRALFLPGSRALDLPLRVVNVVGRDVMAEFAPTSLAEESGVVDLVFGRADAWIGWDRHEPDRPFVSLLRVAQSIGGVFAGNSQFRRKRSAPTVPPQLASSVAGAAIPQPKPVETLAPLRPRHRVAAGVVALLGLSLPAAPEPALAQSPAAPGVAAAAPAAMPGEVRELARTLRQLGLSGPMQLRGVTDLQGVVFGLRADEVVLSASLELLGSWSPALIPALSQLRITLNEEEVGTLRPEPGAPNFGPVALPLSSLFFSENNRLNFRFSGRYTPECNDPLSGLLWLTISDRSVLRLRVARLNQPPDLARLPEPFYDPRELREPLELPVVFRAATVPAGLVRAGIIASSWFAVQADFRGARFPVRRSLPATGNAMVLVASAEGVPELGILSFEGPTLAVRQNPTDPFGQILVIGGRTAAETISAAQALAIGVRGLAGDTARVGQVSLAPRRPYDAPRWIPRDRPVRFGEIVDAGELQGTGFVPAPIIVPLRTAPDLYLPPGRTLEATVRFVGPPTPIADLRVSRMDSFLSDLFLRSTPLALEEPSWPFSAVARWLGGGLNPAQEARVGLPPSFISGQNALRFVFDLRPFNRGDCVAIPEELRVAILPDSTVDLSPARRFALMPNLAFFVTAGFPFTRMADFSETAIALPTEATDEELGAILDVIGRMAGFVGHPAVAVEVVAGGNLSQVADRDILAIGAMNRLPAIAALQPDAPFRIEQSRVVMSAPGVGQQLREFFVRAPRQAERDRASILLTAPPDRLGVVFSFESPLSPSRVVVVATAATPEAMRELHATLFDREAAARMQGDLVVVSGGRVESFRVGPVFERGELPLLDRPRYWFGDRPEFLILFLVGAALAIALPAFFFLRRRARARLKEA